MSLISYPVEFSEPGIKAENLKLTGTDGKELTFQLSEKRQRDDGSLSFAKLNFITDFPTNSERSFVLSKGTHQFKNSAFTYEEDFHAKTGDDIFSFYPFLNKLVLK